MTDSAIFDLFVVGGGINGTGIAADAAGRGLKVALAEMSDLASATSSASSKLIHGGLRYLEHYEFRLVREALAEREVLMRKAPNLISPLRFVLPHVPGVRPRWMVRAGLILYDNLYQRKIIKSSQSINLARDPAGAPLKSEFRAGFTYWDCWVDDARLVIVNAKAARNRGARIMTRTRVIACMPTDGQWRIIVETNKGRREFRARVLVNAAGPWVDGMDALARAASERRTTHHVRLIKGSHLVVPRIIGADDGYLMQGADRRVVFALPFEERFTIIGTTDVGFSGDPAAVAASDEEEKYLLVLANRFFKTRITPADIVWRFSGVRPLYDDAHGDPSAVTRDYHLELDADHKNPPRLSVYGGKITTYRRLAEEAMARLAPFFGPGFGPDWTAAQPLPGGDLPDADFSAFQAGLLARYPAFEPLHLTRLAHRHGTLISAVLGDARRPEDMGAALGHGLTEREVRYMKAEEWAEQPDDVLWRRSKIGLHALTAPAGNGNSTMAAAVASLL